MGRTYRSSENSRYYDGFQEGTRRRDRVKAKKIKSSATKKADKREVYPTSTKKPDYIGEDD